MNIQLSEKEVKKLILFLSKKGGFEEIVLKLKKEPKTQPKKKVALISDSSIKSEKSIQGEARYRKIAEEYRDKKVKEQTRAEVITKAVLKSLKVSFEFQKIFYNEETFYIVDFYLPDFNVVLEIDGGYHSTEEQKLKDKRREKFLRRYNKIKYIGRINNEVVYKTTELPGKIKGIIEYSKTIK